MDHALFYHANIWLNKGSVTGILENERFLHDSLPVRPHKIVQSGTMTTTSTTSSFRQATQHNEQAKKHNDVAEWPTEEN
jgi:hypothetical protein